MSVKNTKPTDAELDVLRVLWEHGPGKVREIHDRLPQTPHRAYTTVLKLLQIMCEKGLVKRDESQRAHIYEVAVSMEQTQQKFVTHLMDKVFDNSMSSLVMRALSNRHASKEELDEIRKLLDTREGDKT